MIENQNTYNPQHSAPMPPGPMMPPPMRPKAVGWQARFMRNYGMGAYAQKRDYRMPSWLIGRSVLFFFIAMLACWGVFGYVPGMDLIVASCVSVLLFFFGAQIMSQKWSVVKEKRFLRNVFIAGFLIRLVWIIYLYFVFNPNHYGNTFGDTADTEWYMAFGRDLAAWMRGDVALPLSGVIDRNMAAIDDVGYPMWLGVVYFLTGDISDVFIPFVVKSIVGAYCATLIYRVAKRHFGVGAARIAAIFVCLNPNMIYWCGTMMKEAEMVFVVCLAVDKLDEALSSGKKLTFRALWPGLLAGLYLFFFRDVLGIALFMGVAAHVVMASNKVLSLGKKIIAGVLIAATLLVAMGDRLLTRSEQLLEQVQGDAQQENMEWRGKREGGNEFAKYAGAAVFAPLIFTIPFPTFNQALDSQLLQVQLSGGSFIKNILSFFVIVVLLLFLASGEWRRHVFIIAYTCTYLVILVFSAFAQSGRFHMPVWPMLMLFAAYGVQLARGNKRLRTGFILVLILEIIICLGWNWFKLKGRGMI
jgi:hypothetical protein